MTLASDIIIIIIFLIRKQDLTIEASVHWTNIMEYHAVVYKSVSVHRCFFKEITPNLTILNSFMTCFKIDSHVFNAFSALQLLYLFKHLLRPITVFIYRTYILLQSFFYLFYVARFKIMLFKCFPLFYFYICSDYVLNM